MEIKDWVRKKWEMGSDNWHDWVGSVAGHEIPHTAAVR